MNNSVEEMSVQTEHKKMHRMNGTVSSCDVLCYHLLNLLLLLFLLLCLDYELDYHKICLT